MSHTPKCMPNLRIHAIVRRKDFPVVAGGEGLDLSQEEYIILGLAKRMAVTVIKDTKANDYMIVSMSGVPEDDKALDHLMTAHQHELMHMVDEFLKQKGEN